ncbi:unnamed protein product [marine sediment metagenome]|uniref:Uncharacterized protein n=1 Tax=marine sediment metagenome TaxID=412755 RepID=X1N0F5_9ZZZZ
MFRIDIGGVSGSPAGRGQNKVRTFWENIVDEIEIPIFDIPLQRT